MDIRELEAFVASVDTGSISQAAARLNRVQSSISTRIKRLEERFGTILLERRAGGISPTEQGMLLYGSAKRILEIVRETKLEMKRSGRGGPSFRLGVVEGVPLSSLNRVIAAQDELQVCLDVSVCKSAILIEGLSSGSLNAAIMESGHRLSNCQSRFLCEEPAVIIGSPSDGDIEKCIKLHDKVFVDRRDGALRRNVEHFIDSVWGSSFRVVECGSYPVLFSNVAARRGIAIVPQSAIDDYSNRSAVQILDVEGEFSTLGLDLVYPAVSPAACSSSVLNLIADVFSQKRTLASISTVNAAGAKPSKAMYSSSRDEVSFSS